MKQGRRHWWIAVAVLLAIGLSAAVLLGPRLTTEEMRFVGTWEYLPMGGKKNKFIQFRDDGSAIWWRKGESKPPQGGYLEWEMRDDVMEVRQYGDQRSAVKSRMLSVFHGVPQGERYVITWATDSEFTMLSEVREGEEESPPVEIVYRRVEDED